MLMYLVIGVVNIFIHFENKNVTSAFFILKSQSNVILKKYSHLSIFINNSVIYYFFENKKIFHRAADGVPGFGGCRL